MKRILLLIILLSAMKCFSQEKIKGIGNFKINETTKAQVDAILASESGQEAPNKYAKNEDNFLAIAESKWAVLIPDSTVDYSHPFYNEEKANLLPLNCPFATVYFIVEYSIANVHFENVYLIFRKDTLIGFVSGYSEEITNAMKLKYGDVKPIIKTKQISCIYTATGNKTTQEETEIIYSWKNGSIEAKSYSQKYSCQGSYITYFSVKDNQKMNTLQKCSNDNYLKIKSKQDSQKKKSLTDF